MFDCYLYKQVKCSKTRSAHAHTSIMIDQNQDRELLFYLLIFPTGTKLENFIFSGNDTEVEMTSTGMVASAYTVENGAFDMKSLAIFWNIAVEGGKQVYHAKKKLAIEDLF